MKFPWFRVYTRMVDDDRIKLLAFEDRWHFVALLCLKGEGLLDKGDEPSMLMRKVAVKLGLDTRALDEVARRLSEVGLIDRNTLSPTKWDCLQQRSDTDSTATERKRRQREREHEEQAEAHRASAEAMIAAAEERERKEIEVTDVSRVTVTNVTRTDIDKEEEGDSSLTKQPVEGAQTGEIDPPTPPALAPAPQPPAPPPAAPAAPPDDEPKAKRAMRLADDWVLPKTWGDWAMQEFPAMTADDVRKQAQVFADYWHAEGGQKARKLDWLATWRNWVRRANERRPGAARPGAAGQPVKYGAAAAAIYDGVNL